MRSADRIQGNPFLLVELIRGLSEDQIVTIKAGRASLVAERLPSRVSDDVCLGESPKSQGDRKIVYGHC